MNQSHKLEKVTLNLPIPIGYKFKSIQLEVTPGDYIISGSGVALVKSKIALKDKNFPGAYFIVIEPI